MPCGVVLPAAVQVHPQMLVAHPLMYTTSFALALPAAAAPSPGGCGGAPPAAPPPRPVGAVPWKQAPSRSTAPPSLALGLSPPPRPPLPPSSSSFAEQPPSSRSQGQGRGRGGGDSSTGGVLARTRDREGCRMVQKALDDAENDEDRVALADCLRGHVWEVARCPHGNHVLQKYVTTMKPSACQFIVDEFVQMGVFGIGKMARHKYACRVLQRLFEHCWPSQLDKIVDCLLADVVALAMQRYGNYVIQHLIEYGSEGTQRRAAKQLEARIAELSLNNDACMVLEKALQSASEEVQDSLVEALLGAPGALAAMAHTRRGHSTALVVLELARDCQLEAARQQIDEHRASLQTNRYGRIVLGWVRRQCEVSAGIGGA